MRLLIYFLGSNLTDKDFSEPFFKNFLSYTRPFCDTAALSVAGCAHPEVCGGLFFPDLKGFAERFTQKIFLKSENNTLVLGDTEQAEVGILDHSGYLGMEISSILLCGCSRGAVTCFEVARQLYQLAPHIPIDIVADQPVSGNVYPALGSNATSIADCRELTNLRHVSIILGANTGYSYSDSFFQQINHLAFFSQIIPQLPANTNRELIVIPTRNHEDKSFSSNHLHMQIAKSLLRSRVPKKDKEEDKKDREFKLSAIENRTKIVQNNYIDFGYHIDLKEYDMHTMGFVDNNVLSLTVHHGALLYAVIPPMRESDDRVRENIVWGKIDLTELGCNQDEFYANDVNNNYSRNRSLLIKLQAKLPEILKITSERGHTRYINNVHCGFPQIDNVQRIFGIEKEHLYQYTDKTNPTSYLRDDFEWLPEEPLMDWWNKHEKNASIFSTKPTKDLITVIQQTKEDDIEALKKLFEASDRWLIIKENSSTSRYYQVQSLRNNIFHRLTKEMGLDKFELIAMNHSLLKEENYFLSHWNSESATASYFKTEDTRMLDRAFVSHSKGEISNDDLISELDEWLRKKQTSNSKRYTLVIEIREKLQEFIRLEALCTNPSDAVKSIMIC